MSSRPTALIAGIGAGLGTSLAKTFAAAGYDIAGLSRSQRLRAMLATTVQAAGGSYMHLSADLTCDAQIVAALEPIRNRVEVLIYVAHALLIKPFQETTPQEIEAVWRNGCFGAMLAARALVPAMVERGNGTIILTGATASIKGSHRFSAFASAKFALRGFAQSLAREVGPAGVHVTHVILDGLIDEAQTDHRFGPASATRMSPDAIASAYLDIARQHPSAWSQEIDLRPFSEKF